MKYDLTKAEFDDKLASLKNVEKTSDPANLVLSHQLAKVLHEAGQSTGYDKGWVNEAYMSLAYDLHIGMHRMLATDAPKMLDALQQENAESIVKYTTQYLKGAGARYKRPEMGFWAADVLQSRAKSQPYTLPEAQRLAALLIERQAESKWLPAADPKQRGYLRFLGQTEDAPEGLKLYRQQNMKVA